MKKLLVYVDTSVVGGCEDAEFAEESLALWRLFICGEYSMVLSEHTIRELMPAPLTVQRRLKEISAKNTIILADSNEATELANAYLDHGAVAESNCADAIHVALATVAGADVLVSWNFKHLVSLSRIRLFNAVNIEKGYGPIEIRSPRELLTDEESI